MDERIEMVSARELPLIFDITLCYKENRVPPE